MERIIEHARQHMFSWHSLCKIWKRKCIFGKSKDDKQKTGYHEIVSTWANKMKSKGSFDTILCVWRGICAWGKTLYVMTNQNIASGIVTSFVVKPVCVRALYTADHFEFARRKFSWKTDFGQILRHDKLPLLVFL